MSGYLWRGSLWLAEANRSIMANRERERAGVKAYGRTWPYGQPPCGTEARYRRHRRAGENCDVCKAGAVRVDYARKHRVAS